MLLLVKNAWNVAFSIFPGKITTWSFVGCEVLERGTISLAGWTFVPASWRSGGCEVCRIGLLEQPLVVFSLPVSFFIMVFN